MNPDRSPLRAESIIASLEYKVPEPDARSRRILRERGMCYCHGDFLPGIGFTGSVELNSVGLQRTPQWLRDQIRTPRKHNSPMDAFPESKIGDRDLDRLVTFLSRLKRPAIPVKRFYIRREDLLDPAGLARRVQLGRDPLGKVLMVYSSENTQRLLREYEGPESPPQELTDALRSGLNQQLVNRFQLFDPAYTATLPLSGTARKLLEHKAKRPDLWRLHGGGQPALTVLNRLLVDAAYPGLIAPYPVTEP